MGTTVSRLCLPVVPGVGYRIENGPAELFENSWPERCGGQDLLLPIGLSGLTGVGFGYVAGDRSNADCGIDRCISPGLKTIPHSASISRQPERPIMSGAVCCCQARFTASIPMPLPNVVGSDHQAIRGTPYLIIAFSRRICRSQAMARLARVVVRDMPKHIMRCGNRRRQTFFADGEHMAYLGHMAVWCDRCARTRKALQCRFSTRLQPCLLGGHC